MKTEQIALSPELAESFPSPINDVVETLSVFLNKVSVAKANGVKFVETSEDIFNHYMRDQKTPYFIFQDVRVYKYGTKEQIIENEKRSALE